MKRYLIETSVDNAEGSQCWYVDASSESEALEKYREGGCDLYSSDVDVTSLGEPEISGETTLDDFGDFAEKPAQPLQQVLTAAVIYEAIKHGDAKHQEWLRHALENVFAGRPVLHEATAPLAEQPAQQEPVATLFGSLPVYDTPSPAQPQHEPVAWILKCGEQQELWWEKPPFGEAVPLYTSRPIQPQQEPVAKIEIARCKYTGELESWTFAERPRNAPAGTYYVYATPPAAQPQQEPGLLDHARCDELVERVMSKLASKHNPAMQSHDLNPNIMTHHALRRSIVQAAYMVGAMSAAHGIKDQP